MHHRSLTPALLLVPTLVLAAPRSQAPDAPWLTFTTPHYRVHCPAAFEAFGREVAGRVEGIHDQYLGLLGFAYEKPMDILILDPVMEANGMALPLLRRPHVVLWKTEPEADSAIGHHRGWAELVVTHELGHMHHLLRPRRNPTLWQRWTDVLGPLTEKSPRWIIEGYATVIEGKLTGSGRPHSAFRAAVLRQWALEGKLPTYEALNGEGAFLGGSLAYLGGSAYLEWLETKAGDPRIFQQLWLRLAGKRPFDEAFTATFGFGPKDGYQRFSAELTHSALELERRTRAQGLREGQIFTQLQGWVSDLSLSPDGKHLLARVLDPKAPGLYVWDLQPSKPTPKKPEPGEPEDHAPLRPTQTPAYRLPRIHGALPWKPRWTSAQTVGFQLRLPNDEGVLVARPMVWTLGQGVQKAEAATPSPQMAPTWKEVDGIWNLVNAQGQPLTRTLGAAWNGVPSLDGRWVYYTQLSATGLQIRQLDTTLPALGAEPLPREPAALVPTVLPKADEPSLLPAPVAVSAHPYRVGESHQTFSLGGYSLAPSGLSAQVGGGGNDLLGRLNWQVLAGLGDGAGPRGAMLGAAWRGWRFAPSLHGFSVLERPSAQRFAPVAGFDRERRGLEVAFTEMDLGRPWARFRPHWVLERVAGDHALWRSRSALGLELHLGNSWSWGDQGLGLALQARNQEGHTEGQRWSLSRGGLGATWLNPWVPLTLRYEDGRLTGAPSDLDRFHLGGQENSLLPASLDMNRVVQAALPAYTAMGNRLSRLRAEVGLGPLQAYLDHSRVWDSGTPRPGAQRVLGLELDSRHLGLPMDTLRRLVGNLSFTLGLHRPLDGAMKGRTVGTLSLLLRP